MSDTMVDVPVEFQKPSISKAALIVGIDRPNFYRSHINPGKISISVNENGTKYIDFSELVRVFGLEKCLAGIRKIASESIVSDTEVKTQGDTVDKQEEHTSLTLTLQVENAKLKAEMQGFKNLSEERYATILEQRDQLRKHFDEIQATRRLLEDKQAISLLQRGFLSRIKSLFVN